MFPSVRWVFNVTKWDPSEKEFLLATSCLQVEEKHRLDKFIYKKDVKASLAGRLMIRKFISESTGLPYNSIKLSRDANNKPIFTTTSLEFPLVSFNISHHGSYAVLAGEIGTQNVGIDVMKFEYKGGKSLEEFFRIMNRNFSSYEWRRIKGDLLTSQQTKLENFCRFWALKESYVKAKGIGITIDLQKISFQINSDLQENKITFDTSLFIENKKQPWIFQESLLDEHHCVVVALTQEYFNSICSLHNFNFIELNSADLLKDAVPLLQQDFQYWKRYFSKDPS